MERCNKMSCYETGRRPVRLSGLSKFGEVNTILLDRKNGDRPPGDLGHAPLKEAREECVPKIILHLLKIHTYDWGDALHEVTLHLEGILQACVCNLWVPMRHPRQGGHRVLPSRNILPQPLCLIYLCPDKAPEVSAHCQNM